MTKDIFMTIRAALPELSDRQKQLAEFVLSNPSKTTDSTIDQLASSCRISVATISRFCKKLGLSSYQELKIRLAASISSREEKDRRLGEIFGDGVFESARKIIASNIRCEENALSLLNAERVNAAASTMAAAERILFLGTPETQLSAMSACGKFLQSTAKAVCFPDSHIQKIGVSMASDKDVALLITDGHLSDFSTELAELIRSVGAKLITIYPIDGFSGEYTSLLSGALAFEPTDPFSAGESVQNFLIDILLVEFVKELGSNN